MKATLDRSAKLAVLEQPRESFYIVFAGVNGAGKSTLFHSKAWLQPHMPNDMVRINPDEIAAYSPQPISDLQAGRIAIARISDLFEKKASFNQETTLSGRSSLRNIKRARELGYRVYLYYVGIQNPEIAIARIAHRVSVGGHNIEPHIVRKRYETSIRNLSQAIAYCEEVHVIDNTSDFHTLARWRKGLLEWWGHPKMHGQWLLDAMHDKDIWLR